MNSTVLRSPAHVSEASWSSEVLEVLDWVNRLSFNELCLAAAWCSSRVSVHVLNEVRSVERSLAPVWAERERTSRERVSVLGRWKHHWAASPELRPCSADGLDLATRSMIASIFTPETFPAPDRRRLQEAFKEVKEVITSVSALSSQEQELALVLAPEWFGTPAELVEASRSIG